jgi:CPA1 family monovalent cation:H+ antiporter
MSNIYTILTIFLTIAIALAYLNAKFIKMQTTSAIMVGSMALSLLLLVLNRLGISQYEQHFEHIVSKLHFHDLLMNGMLSFLLFAGALTIDWPHFKKQKWEIFVLSSLSTIASVILVSVGSYYLLGWLNFPLPYSYCLLFGALISPTDPIAVLSIVTSMKAPKSIETIIAGESLFNDGVGIVIFVTAYQIAFSTAVPTIHEVALLFIQQAIGGIAYGVLLGWGAYHLIKQTKDSKLQILITIAVTTGGYSIAQILNISGPLAMVVAGIFIGNACRTSAVSAQTYKIIGDFWETIDQVLNALLFLLIGFEVLLMTYHKYGVLVCVLSIILVLAVRAITVSLPITLFKLKKRYPPGMTPLLIWGGLRGGLAVALALALPDNHYRDLILSMTYAIVVFAILVQSTTIKGLIHKSYRDVK